MSILENAFVHLFNHFKQEPTEESGGLPLGRIVMDGQLTNRWFTVSQSGLEASLMAIGVPGTGKTSLLHSIALYCIRANWGLLTLNLHPDDFPFYLAAIADEERRRGQDLSARSPFINFLDRQWATGLNLIQADDDHERFILAADLSEMIRARFGLENMGVRILELLRTGIYALSTTGNTLLEFHLLLTNPTFRASLMRQISNTEICAYFQTYDRLSAAEQAMYASGVRNKISELTANPLIADVIGQRRSQITPTQALDQALWMAFNVDKAVLRDLGVILAALIFTWIKNGIFARRTSRTSLVICDEVQNLLVHDSGVDVVLSESRKFHTSLVTANQNLAQLTESARAALLSAHTQCFFRLAPNDAERVAAFLDGGKRLAERLKHLPQRHMIVRCGDQPWHEVVVPHVSKPGVDTTGLYRRCVQRWARPRAEVEQEIRQRHEQFTQATTNALQDWE